MTMQSKYKCVMGRLCAEHGCFEKSFILFEGEKLCLKVLENVIIVRISD